MEVNDIIGKITKDTVKYKEPLWETELVYNSTAAALEPIYFWILDYMEGEGLKIEKLVDNFAASPGSGYFGEMSTKAKDLQEKGSQILQLLTARGTGMISTVMSLIDELKCSSETLFPAVSSVPIS